MVRFLKTTINITKYLIVAIEKNIQSYVDETHISSLDNIFSPNEDECSCSLHYHTAAYT